MIFQQRSRCVLILLGFIVYSVVLLLVYRNPDFSLLQIHRFETKENYHGINSPAQRLDKIQSRRNVSVKTGHRTPPPTGHHTSPSITSKLPLFSDLYEQTWKSQKYSPKLVKDMYEGGYIVANADFCPNSGHNLQLMILIISSPDHSQLRMTIRQTWGYYAQRNNIGVAFVLGIPSSVNQLNEPIRLEMDMYRDIIQSHLVDTYKNLTLKTVSMFEWVDRYCPMVPFVLKSDDDVFINVSNLVEFIKKQRGAQRTIWGKLFKNGKPVRMKKDKFYVSLDEYPLPVLPDYVDGPIYLLTADVVHDLYSTSLNTTFLRFEDAFLTGIVADKVGVQLVNTEMAFRKNENVKNICRMRTSISNNPLNSQQLRLLWQKLHDRRVVCK